MKKEKCFINESCCCAVTATLVQVTRSHEAQPSLNIKFLIMGRSRLMQLISIRMEAKRKKTLVRKISNLSRSSDVPNTCSLFKEALLATLFSERTDLCIFGSFLPREKIAALEKLIWVVPLASAALLAAFPTSVKRTLFP